MGYPLLHRGGNPRTLIQTKYLGGEYSTVEAIIEDLAETFNDPNEKAKARTLYRNLRMRDQERLENSLQVYCLRRTGRHHRRCNETRQPS